jgi:E-phenylitaconyl-CoA hydratase
VYKTILYETKNSIAHITLNRPEVLNAFDSQMELELQQAWIAVKEDPDVKVALVMGAGRAFCAGVDVKEAAVRGGIPASRREKPSLFITAQQNQCWKPVITAVHGMCIGGGLHFVADSDLNICSADAEFFDTHVLVGQVSALEPVGLLTRLSLETVMRMVLLGREGGLDAEQARARGLVSEVVPREELEKRAVTLAEIIKRASPATVARSKKAIWRSYEHGFQEAYDYGWSLIKEHWTHPDFTEGARAFREKRAPRWAS